MKKAKKSMSSVMGQPTMALARVFEFALGYSVAVKKWLVVSSRAVFVPQRQAILIACCFAFSLAKDLRK
jgi:hypothetical protein